jgi:hypothetical protein
LLHSSKHGCGEELLQVVAEAAEREREAGNKKMQALSGTGAAAAANTNNTYKST